MYPRWTLTTPLSTWPVFPHLYRCTPAVWLYVEHSGLDAPELRAIGHLGSRKVAAERAGVTHVFTRPRLKALIRKRNIQLVSYRDLQTSGKASRIE